jgi:hypothetical protein
MVSQAVAEAFRNYTLDLHLFEVTFERPPTDRSEHK